MGKKKGKSLSSSPSPFPASSPPSAHSAQPPSAGKQTKKPRFSPPSESFASSPHPSKFLSSSSSCSSSSSSSSFSPPTAQERLAAAYATSLSSSGLSSLSHPLYARLYRQDAVSRSSPAADGSFLQEILELCPLQTPAASLVESKLSNRAVRLDTLRCASSKTSPDALGSAPVLGGARASGKTRERRKDALKLSRTQAKRLGLFAVSHETCGGRTGDAGRHPRAPGATSQTRHARASQTNSEVRQEGERDSRVKDSQTPSEKKHRGAATEEGELDVEMAEADVSSSDPSPCSAVSDSPQCESLQGVSPFEALLASSFSGLRYEHLEGLHALWLQYTAAVCGAREAAAPRDEPAEGRERQAGLDGPSASSVSPFLSKKARKEERKTRDAASWQKAFDRCTVMSKADLHGAKVKVVRSKTPALVGREGIVVEETQQSLLLLGEDQALRRVMKAGAVLSVEGLDGSTFFLHAQHLQHSAVARSKTKLKPKQSLALE